MKNTLLGHAVSAAVAAVVLCGSSADAAVIDPAARAARPLYTPRIKQRDLNKLAGPLPPVLRQRQASSVAPAPPTATSAVDAPTTGGNGTVITMSNGQTFTYTNNFGGTFASTPGDFSARPQARSPALNETWDFNTNRIQGVNVGGWLITEPFITPGLYLPYQNSTPQAVDEYTLSEALGDDLASYMVNHYETFITEEDFANIAAAGMNWIRLPIGFWAVDTDGGEPFLEGVSWNYMLQAFEWARKYGLRVELDLHAVPGSQNGLNHSGRIGRGVGFMNGVMGIANAQRALNQIRILTETISRPEYQHVLLFNIVNEAYITTIGTSQLRSFYLEAYETMRNITGIGAGNGPIMVIHDGFIGLGEWEGFLSGADRIGLESHLYFAFSPAEFSTNYRDFVTRPCSYWAAGFNQSTIDYGVTIGGEWSLATNDCGLWVNSVGEGAYYDGTHSRSTGYTGSCDPWTDVARFSNTLKQQISDYCLSSMDSFQNFMFWTWKTGTNNATGRPYNPLWCYSCGIEYGYVPSDPAQAAGACPRIAAEYGTGGYASRVPVTDTYAASQTGGTGTVSSISSAQISSYGVFPPTSLTNIAQASRLPRYTPTAAEPALPTAPPTPLSNVAVGQPTGTGWYTSIAGCSYLDPYSGVGAQVPASACTGNGNAAPASAPTAAPTP